MKTNTSNNHASGRRIKLSITRIAAFTLCAVLAISTFSGCVAVNFWNAPGGGVAGIGERGSYTYTVGEITDINIYMLCDVHYYSSASDVITLEIQPNLKEYISVTDSDGVLTLRTTRNIIWSDKPPVLTVSTPALKRIMLAGAGEFTTHDPIKGESFKLDLSGAGSGKMQFDVNRLSVEMSGAATYELSGKADDATMVLSGAGNMDALALQTREASVEMSGAGIVRVNCTDALSIDASGVGSVEYRGSPRVTMDTSGLVSIKQVN